MGRQVMVLPSTNCGRWWDNIKKIMVWEYGLDSFGLEYDQMIGSCEHGNEALDFVKREKFLDQLTYSQFLDDPSPVDLIFYCRSLLNSCPWCVLSKLLPIIDHPTCWKTETRLLVNLKISLLKILVLNYK